MAGSGLRYYDTFAERNIDFVLLLLNCYHFVIIFIDVHFCNTLYPAHYVSLHFRKGHMFQFILPVTW